MLQPSDTDAGRKVVFTAHWLDTRVCSSVHVCLCAYVCMCVCADQGLPAVVWVEVGTVAVAEAAGNMAEAVAAVVAAAATVATGVFINFACLVG